MPRYQAAVISENLETRRGGSQFAVLYPASKPTTPEPVPEPVATTPAVPSTERTETERPVLETEAPAAPRPSHKVGRAVRDANRLRSRRQSPLGSPCRR